MAGRAAVLLTIFAITLTNPISEGSRAGTKYFGRQHASDSIFGLGLRGGSGADESQQGNHSPVGGVSKASNAREGKKTKASESSLADHLGAEGWEVLRGKLTVDGAEARKSAIKSLRAAVSSRTNWRSWSKKSATMSRLSEEYCTNFRLLLRILILDPMPSCRVYAAECLAKCLEHLPQNSSLAVEDIARTLKNRTSYVKQLSDPNVQTELRTSIGARSRGEAGRTMALEEENADVRCALGKLARAACAHIDILPDKRVEKVVNLMSVVVKNLCADASSSVRLAGVGAAASFARIPRCEASEHCPSLTRALSPHLASPSMRLAALCAVSEAIISDPASLRHALGGLESCIDDRSLCVREALAHVVGGSLATSPPLFAPPNVTTAAKLLPILLVGLTDETCEVQDVYAEVLCHLGGMHINGTLPNLEDLAETVWIDPNSDLREGRDPLSSSEGFGVFPHIRKVFLTADGTRKGHSFTPTPSRSIIAVNQELNEGARELVGAHVDQLLRPILEKLPNLMTSSRRLAHRMLSGMIFAATAPSVAPFAETIMCACVHSQQQERSVFSSRFGEGARGASALSDSICLTMQVMSLGKIIGLAHTNIIGVGVVDEHGSPLRSPGHIVCWMDVVASLLWGRSCLRPRQQRTAPDALAEGMCGEVCVSLMNLESRRPRLPHSQGLEQGIEKLGREKNPIEQLSVDDAGLILGMLSTSELIQQSPYIDDDQDSVDLGVMDASRLRLLIAFFEAVRHDKNVLEKSKGQMFVHVLRFSDNQGIVGVRARQLMDALAESLHEGQVENMCRQLGEGLLASLLQSKDSWVHSPLSRGMRLLSSLVKRLKGGLWLMPGGLSDELASLLSRSTDVNLPYDSREALMDMLLQVLRNGGEAPMHYHSHLLSVLEGCCREEGLSYSTRLRATGAMLDLAARGGPEAASHLRGGLLPVAWSMITSVFASDKRSNSRDLVLASACCRSIFALSAKYTHLPASATAGQEQVIVQQCDAEGMVCFLMCFMHGKDSSIVNDLRQSVLSFTLGACGRLLLSSRGLVPCDGGPKQQFPYSFVQHEASATATMAPNTRDDGASCTAPNDVCLDCKCSSGEVECAVAANARFARLVSSLVVGVRKCKTIEKASWGRGGSDAHALILLEDIVASWAWMLGYEPFLKEWNRRFGGDLSVLCSPEDEEPSGVAELRSDVEARVRAAGMDPGNVALAFAQDCFERAIGMLNVLPVSMEQEEEEVSYVDIPQHEGVVHDTVWSKNGQNHAIMSVSSSEAE